MILVDAVSIIWLVGAVLWGYVIARVLVALFENWWRIQRWASERWAAFPPVAELRYRRAEEEFNWWWVNATPEQRERRRLGIEAMERLSAGFAEIATAFTISANQAAKGFEAFGRAYRKAMDS